MERCRSGLTGQSRKLLSAFTDREFESLPLRQKYMNEEHPRSRLKYANWLLVFLILVINGYVIVSPLLPQIDLWWRKHQTQAVAGLPYQTKTDQSKNCDRKAIPADNRLVIPKLALN